MNNQFYCDKHNPMISIRRKDSIQAQDITVRYVDDDELMELGFARKEENEKAKSILEDSGGFSNELLCGRCGTSIEKTHKMTMSGLFRYHEICPSKEEIDASNKSLKYFLRKLPGK
jgi:hypothetical protein